HGSKRTRRANEEEHDDLSLPPQSLRRYGLRWVKRKKRERVCLVFALITGMPINVGVIIKNVLSRARAKRSQIFGFGGLLIRFLRGNEIEKEEVDYRPIYDPKGNDVTNIKEPKGVNGPDFSANERNARIDNMLSHLNGMHMLQKKLME
ncbi:hypothetical protein HAX54_002338, partial [Datura stramonium]|nr:hypothetical protein [Datura stramonium]